jgi:hypothetical protein
MPIATAFGRNVAIYGACEASLHRTRLVVTRTCIDIGTQTLHARRDAIAFLCVVSSLRSEGNAKPTTVLHVE